MQTHSSKPWLTLRTLFGALALAALVAAVHLLPLAVWFQHFDHWVARLGWAGPLIFVVVYVSGTVLFVPGSVMTIAAGVLFGLWAIPIVSAGSTLGAALAFLIARHLAREKVAKLVAANEKFRALDQAVGEQGGRLIALLRLSPLIPFNLSNYLYGLTNVGFWPYVLASWLGMLPGCCLYVYLGAAGKVGLDHQHRPRGALADGFFGIGLAATIIVTVIVTRVARRALGSARAPKA